MPQQQQIIALVDGVNFYASVERAFRADLDDTPIIVLSNNDGAIVTANEKAKRIGLTRGMPFFRVRSLVERHEVAVFSSNYALYQNVSDRLMRCLASFAEVRDGIKQQEIYSIDECYLHLSPLEGESIVDLARRMQAEALRATGVPVRVGIGSTKVRAKVAALLAKRDPSSAGFVSLLDYGPEALLQVLETISVEDIWGLGKRSCDKLRLRRIATGRALYEADPAWVRRFLSVTGQRIVYELRGVSCLPLEVQERPKQEIVVARFFGTPIEREADLAEAVAHYAAWAAEKLRAQGSVTGHLTVFVSSSRFEPPSSLYAASAGTRLLFPTNFTPDLFAAAHRVLREVYRPGVRYQRAGVVLRALGSQEVLQADLFG